jgi:hypothetical protein
MTTETFLALLLTTGLMLGCRTSDVNLVSLPSCSMHIRTDTDRYLNAGDVRIVVEPKSVAEIPIVLPWEANFFAVDLDRNPRWETRDLTRATPARLQARNYPVVWGLPASVWYASRRPLGDGRYELSPGRYQLVIKYSLNGSSLCHAATDPFVIEQSTFWVSTVSPAG